MLLTLFINIVANKHDDNLSVSINMHIYLGERIFNAVLKALYLKSSHKDSLKFNAWVKLNKENRLVELFDVAQLNSEVYTSVCGAIFASLLVEHDMLYESLHSNDELNMSHKYNAYEISPDGEASLGNAVIKMKCLPINLPMVEKQIG